MWQQNQEPKVKTDANRNYKGNINVGSIPRSVVVDREVFDLIHGLLSQLTIYIHPLQVHRSLDCSALFECYPVFSSFLQLWSSRSLSTYTYRSTTYRSLYWLVSPLVYLYLCLLEVLFCGVQLKLLDFSSTLRCL